jgi:hypothetical protein
MIAESRPELTDNKRMPRPGDLAPGFTIEPDRCWRMVFNENLQGSHCQAPVCLRGGFKDHAGKAWTVDACEAHAHELRDLQPVPD